MGNCSSLNGTSGQCPSSIRVLTDSGDILQFKGPKLAAEILADFPGYGVFRQGNSSLPVPDEETLICGQYFFLPLKSDQKLVRDNGVVEEVEAAEAEAPQSEAPQAEEPVKKSFGGASDFVENLANGSTALEVLPAGGDGVWRVKLVINTKQLEEILSEQGNTEALIETMRMAASAGLASTPKTKSLWGGGVWKKPIFSNLFRPPTTEQGI